MSTPTSFKAGATLKCGGRCLAAVGARVTGSRGGAAAAGAVSRCSGTAGGAAMTRGGGGPSHPVTAGARGTAAAD